MKKLKAILIILLISSCTISHKYYPVSSKMGLFRDILHSASYNGFIPRRTLFVIKSYLQDKFEYVSENYEKSRYVDAGNMYMMVLENKKNKNVELKNRKLIFTIHGGGFYSPLDEHHIRHVELVAEKTKYDFDIIAPDYSVYPKKYPTAHDDLFEAYKKVLELGYNTDNISIIADSAGGHLAVSMLLRLKDNNIKLPKAVILYSPWIDIKNEVSSRIENRYSDILFGTIHEEEPMDDELVNPPYFKGASRENPYVSPLEGNFEGFPYFYIQVERTEILYGDSEELYKKLIKENVKADLKIFEGSFHAFQTFATESIEEMVQAHKMVTDKLNEIYK